MSLRTARVVTCDFPGCTDEYVGRAWKDAHTQRLDAVGNHWAERKVGGQWFDLCPEHKYQELPS